jgi:hypothetical protein
VFLKWTQVVLLSIPARLKAPTFFVCNGSIQAWLATHARWFAAARNAKIIPPSGREASNQAAGTSLYLLKSPAAGRHGGLRRWHGRDWWLSSCGTASDQIGRPSLALSIDWLQL